MAPPSKITPEIVDALERVIASGGFDEDACLVAGIHRSTLTEWRRKAARGEEPFASMVTRLDAARATATAAALEKMRAHEDWRAASEWLAKTQPHRYAAQQRVIVERAVEESRAPLLEALRAEMDDASYAELMGRVVRRLNPGDDTRVIDAEVIDPSAANSSEQP